VKFPAEAAARRERAHFMATIEGLTDTEFSSAPTLCEGWAPRDVLAHLIGTDQATRYLRGGLRIDRVNTAITAEARHRSRADLTGAGRRWATEPSAFGRAISLFLLGDLAIHHQDVLRGLGRTRAVPEEVSAAIYREGVLLSLLLNRRVLRHRLIPTPGRPLGRGRTVSGPREALGMWLAGRDAAAADLEFGR
jgi:uncharacterized protein (TIGR03083 family)